MVLCDAPRSPPSAFWGPGPERTKWRNVYIGRVKHELTALGVDPNLQLIRGSRMPGYVRYHSIGTFGMLLLMLVHVDGVNKSVTPTVMSGEGHSTYIYFLVGLEYQNAILTRPQFS